MESQGASDGTNFELPGYLITGSTLASIVGKGRTKGVARVDAQNLTYYNKKGVAVLTQPLAGITATEFKRMTGGVIVKGDTTFKLYPPTENSGSGSFNDAGDVGNAVGTLGDMASALSGIAQARFFHDALNEAVSRARNA